MGEFGFARHFCELLFLLCLSMLLCELLLASLELLCFVVQLFKCRLLLCFVINNPDALITNLWCRILSCQSVFLFIPLFCFLNFGGLLLDFFVEVAFDKAVDSLGIIAFLNLIFF